MSCLKLPEGNRFAAFSVWAEVLGNIYIGGNVIEGIRSNHLLASRELNRLRVCPRLTKTAPQPDTPGSFPTKHPGPGTGSPAIHPVQPRFP